MLRDHLMRGAGLLIVGGSALAGGSAGEAPMLATATAPEAPAPIAAAPSVQDTDQDWSVSWNGNLRFRSADGNFEYRLGGRIHQDTTFIGADSELTDPAGAGPGADADDARVGFRRARLQLDATLYKNVVGRTQYDFAGGSANFRDVYVQLRDLVGGTTLWIGQFREPFSLDTLNSSNDNAFLERSLADQLSPQRRTGIAVSGNAVDKRLNWKAGVFHAGTDGSDGDATGDGEYAVTGRVAFAPWMEEARVLHVGGAVSYREIDEFAISLRRPEFDTAVGGWLASGSFGDSEVLLLGAEAALIQGPFAAQAEWIQGDVDGDTADADPMGYYVQATWVLTGESRRYSGGTIQRPKPTSPWTGRGTGCGAWELGVRYSHLDLDVDGSDQEATAMTVGVNWFANDALALRANYVCVDFEDFDASAHAVGLRVQLVF